MQIDVDPTMVPTDDPDQVGTAWDEAIATDRPCVLVARTDPAVPPIPPHATFDQVKATAAAFVGGDEDRWGFLKQGAKQKAQEYLPGGKSAG